MAPTPHPSPLPREREPVFQGIDGCCSEAGTLPSLADVRKTPPCEAREGREKQCVHFPLFMSPAHWLYFAAPR